MAVAIKAPVERSRDQQLRWLSEETSRRSRSGWNRFVDQPATRQRKFLAWETPVHQLGRLPFDDGLALRTTRSFAFN
jgi:hypothetical protein